MGTKDPRVDDYIEKSAEFARPILRHLRDLVHRGCPEVEETLKWSMPAFTHKGLVCMMAAFKQHATFSLWKHDLVVGKEEKEGAMGQFGRLTALTDLPADETVLEYLRKAAELNEVGTKTPPRARAGSASRHRLVVPDYLVAALKKNHRARLTFENLSRSHKREYVEWLTAAKRKETRQKRLQTALAWLGEGKPHNWQYRGQ